MVIEEVGAVRQWLKSLEVTPTIVALKSRVEDIKRAEVEKVLGTSHESDAPRARVGRGHGVIHCEQADP